MSASERIRIRIEGEDELRRLMALMDEAIHQKAALTGMGAMPAVANIPALSRDIDKIMMDAGGLDVILTQVETTEVAMMGLQDRFMDMNLPTMDRATRVLAMRVPILREVIRLISVIKRSQWAMDLGGIRGPVTAALTMAIYFSMLAQQLERRQDQIEARLLALEKDMDLRMISMEEAVRGYGVLPERYRATVVPG